MKAGHELLVAFGLHPLVVADSASGSATNRQHAECQIWASLHALARVGWQHGGLLSFGAQVLPPCVSQSVPGSLAPRWRRPT